MAEHPNISNAELARRSFVTAPTMIRIITTLSEAMLIARAERTAEERVRRLTLTQKGHARLAAAAVHVQQLEDLLVEHAGPESTGTILAWLRSCADNLDQQPAVPSLDSTAV
ncbi:MAG: hypothetical protein ACR2JX_07640 [Mycobacteriales bacterium]